MSSICITDILHRLHLVLDFDISLYVSSVSYVLVLTRLQIVLLPSSLPLFTPSFSLSLTMNTIITGLLILKLISLHPRKHQNQDVPFCLIIGKHHARTLSLPANPYPSTLT